MPYLSQHLGVRYCTVTCDTLKSLDCSYLIVPPQMFSFKTQPNIRRTFPGRSVPVKNDDDDNDDEVGTTGHNTAGSYHPNVGGGKQFGKSLRPPTNDDDVDDDDDDDDDDDEDSEEDDEEEEGTKPTPTTQYAVRRSGKQFAAGAGKYLRPYVLQIGTVWNTCCMIGLR